jgi:intraflagellar transport protein 140
MVGSSSEVIILFCTSDFGVLMQDSFPIGKGKLHTHTHTHTHTHSHSGLALMGLKVPHLFFMARPSDAQDEERVPRVKRRPLRDFVGLEEVNEEVKRDLLNFSYYLTVGNMDEAYRAVKTIQSDSIWENMAKMCVKTRRLDVAEVCLGNMQNARGAKVRPPPSVPPLTP